MVSEEDDLSFISHSEDFHEIEDVEEWRARNDKQDLRLLREANRVLNNLTVHCEHQNTKRAREIIDLTAEVRESSFFKRYRFG